MSYLIKNPASTRFLHTEIDSGGMSVTWMDIIYADKFENFADAESFVARCRERYPNSEFEIVRHDS